MSEEVQEPHTSHHPAAREERRRSETLPDSTWYQMPVTAGPDGNAAADLAEEGAVCEAAQQGCMAVEARERRRKRYPLLLLMYWLLFLLALVLCCCCMKGGR